MKVFSTFTGIGGFEIGITKAWESTVSPLSSDFIQIVGYSEIDKYAVSVYERHFKGVKNYGDITKIKAEDLPDFDCLVGGFPCQAFSVAGKRRGFEDTRGTLFFDLARILKEKQPRLFVFENVKGLLSHKNIETGVYTFPVIIQTIDELGYDCEWQVLNSKNHGVPQNRERIIIVGHLRGTPRPEVFPFGRNYTETSNPPSEKGIIVDLTRREPGGYRERKDNRAGTLDANYYKGIANQERPGVIQIGQIYDNPHNSQAGRVYDKNGISPTIDVAAGGNRQPKIFDLKAPTSSTRRGAVSDKGIAKTLDHNGYQGVEHGASIRRLTPKECERLQAFPDDWTSMGLQYVTDEHGILTQKPYIISDTQRYKMCGNAVTTNVIRDVFIRIFQSYQLN